VKSSPCPQRSQREKKGISRWLDAVWYRWYARTCRTAKTNAAKRRRYRSSAIEEFSTLSLSLFLFQRRRLAASRRRRDGWASVIMPPLEDLLVCGSNESTNVRRLQVISAQTLPATSSLTVDHQQSDRGKRSFQRNSRKIATDRILWPITIKCFDINVNFLSTIVDYHCVCVCVRGGRGGTRLIDCQKSFFSVTFSRIFYSFVF